MEAEDSWDVFIQLQKIVLSLSYVVLDNLDLRRLY